MSEQKRQTFLEKLTILYPNQFKIEKTSGCFSKEVVVFPAKNKRFGNITIDGDIHNWEDEDDYDEIKFDDDNYQECGGDFQDYCDDISLYLYTKAACYSLTPTELFVCLDKVFTDKMVIYSTFKPWLQRKKGLHERGIFEELIKNRNIRVSKKYKLCLWSGNYSL